MNTTISNNGLPGLAQATGSSKGSGNAATPAAPAGTGGPTAAADQLKLTDSARALQQATRADAGATVDTLKVERIRQSLADGSYQINAAKIADRMTAMDRQAGGTGKV
ncbi:MAG: flagellar biosynthesis anti-sigma factor FlgM [Pseudomonadota bacterium]|jgi:negative regulator of flagellin synthesis FlgM|nr:flagellar biosynthesis anti-sigma factor FlgM [Xanthomonadaceae bacterium]MDE2247464.1 flagellar biosynthesis anti-sigma factor FlgM [Xanthomonadaceae bacterium]MDE3209304.1 flagellar biosynthesis anti-sigma factor FlgM [Pseudomonadota bacterium]